MTTTIEILRKLGACDEAIEWVGERTPREAWEQCDNPRWLLWAAEKARVAKAPCVRASCRIARTVLHLATTDHARLAIEAAEAWLADPSEVNRISAAAAGNAAYDAAAAAAASAAYAAAADAADAADAATYAAYAAYYAARAAHSATDTAAYAATTYATSRAAICAIIRDEIPWADVAAGLGVES